MKTLFAILIASLLIIGCTKHKDDVHANVPKATVALLDPTEGSVFNYGDTITIRAKAISTETIHGCDLVIKKANDTTVYFSKHIHDHNDTLNLNHKWKNTVSTPTQLEVQVTFPLDHDGTHIMKKVRFWAK